MSLSQNLNRHWCRYGDIEPGEAKRFKAPEYENARLEKMVAEMLMFVFEVSERKACQVVGQVRSGHTN